MSSGVFPFRAKGLVFTKELSLAIFCRILGDNTGNSPDWWVSAIGELKVWLLHDHGTLYLLFNQFSSSGIVFSECPQYSRVLRFCTC